MLCLYVCKCIVHQDLCVAHKISLCNNASVPYVSVCVCVCMCVCMCVCVCASAQERLMQWYCILFFFGTHYSMCVCASVECMYRVHNGLHYIKVLWDTMNI